MLRDKIYSFRVMVLGSDKINSLSILPKHIRDLITPPCPEISRTWDTLLEAQDPLFSSAPRLELVVDVDVDDVPWKARNGIRSGICTPLRRFLIPFGDDEVDIPVSGIHRTLYRDYISLRGLRAWDANLRFADVVLNSPACHGV